MKKGFTLTELLGVIVILGAIALLSFPPIINQIKKSKQKIDDSNLSLISSSFELYLSENKNTVMNYGLPYCIKLQTLVSDGKLNTPIKNSDDEEINVTLTYLKVIKNDNDSNQYELVKQVDIDNNNSLCTIIPSE